jgi:Spy/CpxP family protein refolding chaperone
VRATCPKNADAILFLFASSDGTKEIEIMDTTEGNIPRTARPRARRGLWLGLALLVGAAGLATAMPFAQAQGIAADGGPGPGAFDGHMAFRMQRLLDKVGASPSQKSQIKAIWDGLRPQLKGLRQQHGQIREQIAQAMTAPTIDTAQIEKLRQQSVQLMDKTSSVITQGMVQSAQVLTPDQRKQVLAEIQSHRNHWNHGQNGQSGNPGQE